MQKQFKHNKKFIFLILLFLFSSGLFAGKYTMVIEPTFPVEQGKQVYEPLRKWLSEKTGHQIEIIIDNNYYSYWRRANGTRMPDFTFDAPHIAAYRAKNKNYTAIATTMEELSFHLISLDEPQKDENLQDYMIGKKVIMLPSPSLASVFFSQWFTDLFASPEKNVTALSWQEAIEIVFDGSSETAIVPDWIFNLYPNFASLKESGKMPGSTFMASPNVPKEVVEIFQSSLLALMNDDAAYDVLTELNTEGFVMPKMEKYEELIKLLPGNF